LKCCFAEASFRLVEVIGFGSVTGICQSRERLCLRHSSLPVFRQQPALPPICTSTNPQRISVRIIPRGNRAANIAQARQFLAAPSRSKQPDTSEAAAKPKKSRKDPPPA